MIKIEIVGDTSEDLHKEASKIVAALESVTTNDRVEMHIARLREDIPRLLEFWSPESDLTASIVECSSLTPAALADAFAVVERGSSKDKVQLVKYIGMNARDYSDFRKFGGDVIDPETRRAVMLAGSFGCVWGAEIIVNEGFPVGHVLLVDEEFKIYSRIKINR